MENKVDKEIYLAQWLSGDITDVELKELTSTEEFDFFLKFKKGIDVHAKLEEPASVSFNKLQSKLNRRKEKPKVRQLYYKWVSGIAAIILVSIGLFSLLSNDGGVAIETAYGEHKTVNLLDGSEVVLNSKSKIEYSEENWKENRALNLDGEAFFKVQKGSQFTVNTSQGIIRVLGTQFNVSVHNDYFEVICYEGKVAVASGGKSYVLTPQQKVRLINGKIIKDDKIGAIQPSWIYGESSFESVPIRQVIVALERQYDIKINAIDIDKSIVFTGSFPNKDQELALQTVFKPLNINVTTQGKKEVRLSYHK